MANQWFRLYAEFATDPKVQMLSESDQRRYIMLLCVRCNGDVTLQDEEVAFQLRISNEEWAQTKAVFISKSLITEDNKPTAWDKRQYISDSSAARVAKHRNTKKQERNVTVTPPDTDTDTDKKKEKTSISHEKIVFDGSSFQNLNGQVDVWAKAYPAINVDSEINKAAAWLVANPKNKKSQLGRFLNGWLSRAQDKAPRVSTQQSSQFGDAI